MKCWGVTLNKRLCRREVNLLFCPEHAVQPFIASIGVILGFVISVAASYLATHYWVALSESELKHSDFKVELVSSRHAGQKPYKYEPSDSLHILVSVGSVLIDSTLNLEPRGSSWSGGGRNPWQTWYYPSKRMNLTFENDITLESLVGKSIWAMIPNRALYPKSKNKLKLWIKGSEITLTPSVNGEIKYTLTNQDLGLNSR